MNNPPAYATIEKQIAKLKSQNLLIEDEEYAKRLLSTYGYSNLIKSYRDPYIVRNGDQVQYRSGITIEQIFSLYTLDKNLRNSVMAAMTDLEEFMKESTADVIAKSFGTDPAQYLLYRNYQNRRKKKQQFSLTSILKSMQNALQSDKDPIKHYRNKYGIVPPWILFKGVYFSTITNYIDQLKQPETDALVDRFYDRNKLSIPIASTRYLLHDTLAICNEYRNLSAHGGRVYNYHTNASLRTQAIFGQPAISQIGGFSELLLLLSLLQYSLPFQLLSNALNNELSRHCSKYPQDVTYLGQILNINIRVEEHVYITNNSNKYHKLPHCSGIKKPTQIPLESAKSQGYLPCRRCCT